MNVLVIPSDRSDFFHTTTPFLQTAANAIFSIFFSIHIGLKAFSLLIDKKECSAILNHSLPFSPDLPMDTKRLFNTLAALHPLSDEFKSSLLSSASVLHVSKDRLLLNAPAVAAHAYYLHSGFVMSFSLVEGKRITRGFWKSGQLFVSHKSFLEQVASKESLQVMMDSELLGISYEHVQRLLKQFEEARHLYHALLDRYHEQCMDRLLDMQRFTAAERLERLLHQFPALPDIVPQDAIASYLGITPQSFSRIKRKIKKK